MTPLRGNPGDGRSEVERDEIHHPWWAAYVCWLLGTVYGALVATAFWGVL